MIKVRIGGFHMTSQINEKISVSNYVNSLPPAFAFFVL